MSRGAPDATAAPPEEPARRRRGRPILVELAAALLIVGGAMNLLLSIQVLTTLGERGEPIGPLTLITIVLAVATLALGLLVRYGQAWLLTVNVVAVLAFLELTAGSPVGLLFGVIDTIVVLALFREREWFRTPMERTESDLRSYGG